MDVLEQFFQDNREVAIHDAAITLEEIKKYSFTEILKLKNSKIAQGILDGINKVFDPYDKMVLDVGCGVGYFSFLLAEAGASVVGVDANPLNTVVAEHIKIAKSLNCEIINKPIDEFLKTDTRRFHATLLLNVFDQMLRENEKIAWESLNKIRERSSFVFIMAGSTEQLPNMAGQRTSFPKHVPLEPQFESWELGYEMIQRKGNFKHVKLLLRNSYAQRDLLVFY